ncbi:MliC family protein [Thioalkalivibrio sulfidiphilus]|uniref:MliC family protein n=1 Tax=Thioalkalivibrio sulfidiphilus TaxID=1033854 RepID=UPI003B343E7B
MNRVPSVVLILVLLAGLSACQRSPHQDPWRDGPSVLSQSSLTQDTRYQCAEQRVETRLGEHRMQLRLPERDLVLDAVVSASGARYEDADGNGFWSKGPSEALLRLQGGAWVNCEVTEARSPWVAARDRGVVYRAVGQEPGWVVEVWPGEAPAIILVMDYGQRRLEIPRARRLEGDAGYAGEAGDVAVSLHILREACTDVMSGEVFPTRAEMRLDGSVYRGCGQELSP